MRLLLLCLLLCLTFTNVRQKEKIIVILTNIHIQGGGGVDFMKIKTSMSSQTISLLITYCKMGSVPMCVNVSSVSLCLSTKVCFTNLSTVTIWERAFNF